jgi:hypothetical protein
MKHYGTERVQWRLLPRKRFWQFNLQVELLQPFTYFVNGDIDAPLLIPAGVYDGFSVPWLARAASLFQITQVMPGIEAAFVHDFVCRVQWSTRRERRDLFIQAYDAAMREFYPKHAADAWSAVVIRSVVIGSKYLRAC